MNDYKKQIIHDQYYFLLMHKLCKSKKFIKKVNFFNKLFSVKNKTSWVNMQALHCLTHLVFLSKLKHLVAHTDISNLSNNISKWVMKYDKRVFFLIAQIKQDNELLMLQNYLDIIYYTIYKNFKLRYLARILCDIMIEKKQKLLIFVEKLMFLWQIKVFLNNFDMNVKVIYSQMN